MNFKLKGITWVENIYQKVEAMCQEVDDIVSQDAVKYVENQVQNVGDSVKKFYSDIVQELRPPLVNSVKHEDQSVALKNNDDSLFKSVASVKESRKGTEENPSNNAIKSMYESIVNDPANNQQAHGSIGHEFVNEVSDETSSNYIEMEDSYLPEKEFGNDFSRETSNVLKDKAQVNVQQTTNSHTLSFESSIFSGSSSGLYDNGCGALPETEDKLDVEVEQNSCVIVEENVMKFSTPQVLDFRSLDEKESSEASIFSQSSGVIESASSILVDVSPATSVTNGKSQTSSRAGTINDNFADKNHCVSDVAESSDIIASSSVAISTLSCEKNMVKVEPFCFKSNLASDGHPTKSSGSYFSGTESSKSNSVDHIGSVSDRSMALLSCAPASDVVGHIMASKVGLVSSGKSQPMDSNGESLVDSIKSSMEDIQLHDEKKLEESRLFVDDSELYAVSHRVRRLRSYKKRIRDAFSRKKRLTKQYEQLAIWYGDSGMESRSENVLPSSSTISLDAKNLRVQHACDSEWELL